MSALSLAIILIAGAVVAFAYALLQPDLTSLRSEQMKAEMKVEGTRIRKDTPIFDLIDRFLKALGWKPFTEDELSLAGIKSSVTSVVATTLLIAFVTFAVGAILLGSLFLAFVLAVLSPFVVKMYVGVKTTKRRARFEKQMAEAMTLFSSALKAGMNVPTALANTATEMEAPMGEELARIVNETRLGRDLIEGMRATSQRMDSQDFMWVTEAVAIQRESGGRLSEILDRVTETIAQRNELKEKIASLAAEGKMSGYVLMGLPVAVGLGFTAVNPAYIAPLVTTTPGKIMLLAALVLYGLGGLWLNSITKVKL